MSLRFLYRQMPVTKRVCSYYRCQEPILRNIAKDKKGRLYHYGCLMSALDEKFQCLECLNRFDGTDVVFEVAEKWVDNQVSQILLVRCPHCGCENIKRLYGGN
jgi:hypothetical protein